MYKATGIRTGSLFLVLWCHSHLVWGFHSYMCLFSWRKIFCDLSYRVLVHYIVIPPAHTKTCYFTNMVVRFNRTASSILISITRHLRFWVPFNWQWFLCITFARPPHPLLHVVGYQVSLFFSLFWTLCTHTHLYFLLSLHACGHYEPHPQLCLQERWGGGDTLAIFSSEVNGPIAYWSFR